MDAIKVENLTKNFNGVIAVDHISFSIQVGELLGLLGPNGAGKTTTINGHEINRTRESGISCHDVRDEEGRTSGMKRRLEIARGLIHKPQVLFQDEPTLGLDAQTRRHIWDYIKKLNKVGGITIILTSLYMEEADFLCDRIGIIDNGKIVTMDSPERLK